MRAHLNIKTGLAALGLSLGLVGAPVVAAPVSSGGTAIAIMQASAALQAGDCKAAKGPLNLLWHDPYLEQNDPATAAGFRLQLIACTAQLEGLPAALALSTENLTRAYDVNAYDFHVFLQLMASNTAGAADTLEAGLTRFPDQAPNFSDMSVLGVLVALQGNPERGQALLNHLEETYWQVHDLSANPLMGMLRLEGLRTAVRTADAPHADLYRAALKTNTLFYILSQGDGNISRADVPAVPVRPVLNGEIEAVKAVITANPANLMALNYLMNLEQVNDQNALALTQLGGILDLVDQYGLDKFSSPESYPDLLTHKAELYARTGNVIEAGKAYEAGATKLGAEKSNDILLSYMNFLVDRGQDQAGLAIKRRLSTLDEGQAATQVATEACAQGYLGDKVSFAASMAQLEGADIMRIKPYLCAGDTENAARSVIAAMANPDTRDTMIAFMQDGLPPISVSNRDDAFIAALLALKKRPDVLAAAEASHIIIRQWPVRLD